MEKILLLGGTNFIGRNLVEHLLNQGQYELTLLNRGKTNADLFTGVKRIIADRNTAEISKKIQGDWDYIIDLSCYFPRSLERIIPSLPASLKKYIFISTCSVYKDEEPLLQRTESANTKQCDPKEYEDESPQSYGNRKSACEKLLQESTLNYVIFRPALVYGAFDPTDRFYYWLHQVKSYHSILIPNTGEQKFSLTYVKDLTDSIVQSLNPTPQREVYNAISHPVSSIRKIITAASELLGVAPSLISISSSQLKEHEIKQWVDMPLWLDCDYYTYSNAKLLADYQLSITEWRQSVATTIEYYDTLNWPLPKYGIDRSKQSTLMDQLNRIA